MKTNSFQMLRGTFEWGKSYEQRERMKINGGGSDVRKISTVGSSKSQSLHGTSPGQAKNLVSVNCVRSLENKFVMSEQ